MSLTENRIFSKTAKPFFADKTKTIFRIILKSDTQLPKIFLLFTANSLKMVI